MLAQEDAIKGLEVSFHNVGEPHGNGTETMMAPDAAEQPCISLYVRTSDGLARKEKFPIDKFGKAIVPEGVQIL